MRGGGCEHLIRAENSMCSSYPELINFEKMPGRVRVQFFLGRVGLEPDYEYTFSNEEHCMMEFC